jgi:hypothetical protein
MTPARWLRSLASVTCIASVVGCSHLIAGTPVTQTLAGGGNCLTVSAPLSTIEPKTDTEPLMQIPQPPGWERTTMLDSEIVRYALVNRSLTTNRFAPSAIVTVEDVTNKGLSPKEVITQEWLGVTTMAGGTDMVTMSDEPVCGLPAQQVTYKLPAVGGIPARTASALAIVTPGVKKYAVVVSVHTSDPNEQTYLDDSFKILRGFHIEASPSASP